MHEGQFHLRNIQNGVSLMDFVPQIDIKHPHVPAQELVPAVTLLLAQMCVSVCVKPTLLM